MISDSKEELGDKSKCWDKWFATGKQDDIKHHNIER